MGESEPLPSMVVLALGFIVPIPTLPKLSITIFEFDRSSFPLASSVELFPNPIPILFSSASTDKSKKVVCVFCLFLLFIRIPFTKSESEMS